jgi:hypothetical protein
VTVPKFAETADNVDTLNLSAVILPAAILAAAKVPAVIAFAFTVPPCVHVPEILNHMTFVELL